MGHGYCAALLAVLAILLAAALAAVLLRHGREPFGDGGPSDAHNIGVYDSPYKGYPKYEGRAATAWDSERPCVAYCSQSPCTVWCR